MSKKTSINQRCACELLFQLIDKNESCYPICSSSFNVMLEGLFRNSIKQNNDSFYDQFIDYKGRVFYITKIKTNYSNDDVFLPILKNDDIDNIINVIHVNNKYDDFYLYYDWAKDKNGDLKSKPFCRCRTQIKDRIIALAVFYNLLTQQYFFVQENQYFKALLFKMLFNSQNSESQKSENTNRIIKKASDLVAECVEANNDLLVQRHIGKRIDNIEPYIICNAFIDVLNQLNNNYKNEIKQIYNENHRGQKLFIS